MEKSKKAIWRQKIRTIREIHRWSQQELAEYLDTSRSSVAKWEAGTTVPSPEQDKLLSQIIEGDIPVRKSKPEWAIQILNVRKRHGLSQQALADYLQIKQPSVAAWEAGASPPSPGQYMKLARLAEGETESAFFIERAGIPESFLAGASPQETIPRILAEKMACEAENRRISDLLASGAIAALEGKMRMIPLLRDAVAAGTPRAVDENEIEQTISIPNNWLPRGGTLYAVRISGQSMSPVLLNGHIVIIDVSSRDPKKLIEHMVAAREDDGITIKWLRQDDEAYMLVPQHVSPKYPVRIMRPQGNFSIVGEVVMWIGVPPKIRK